VMFENEHTFCSWIHRVRMILSSWRERRPSNQGDLDSSVTGEVGRVLHGGGNASGVPFLYCSTWLLLCCVLNGTASNNQIVQVWLNTQFASEAYSTKVSGTGLNKPGAKLTVIRPNDNTHTGYDFVLSSVKATG
jgi:hypothetical protein